MKRLKSAFFVIEIFAILIFSLSLIQFVAPVSAAGEIHVNPIDDLSPDFIMGADVSMLKQIEDSGGKFYEDGVETDCLTILKNHGVNWIRLRLWNDPTDADGNPLGGGNNDLASTVAIASRAKAMGFKFLLDFHYSDWWADPGQQTMPKAWEGLSLDELETAVYDYTVDVIQTLADADAMPDMVQIGNEVNGGMLWDVGSTASGSYDNFAALLRQGIQAVRDTDPHNDDPQARARIVIHLANGGDNRLYHRVFDALSARDVDFDVIGLSYYGYWHGSLDDLERNMNDISQRYDKDVIVAETAYAVTLNDKDGFPNLFAGERDQYLGGYKATVQGQATAIRDVMAAVAQVPDGRGLGIFYWEPDWIAVDGAGWKTGEGNAWENQAMFSFKGEALPSMDVFNRVRPESGSTYEPAVIARTYPTTLDLALGDTLTLPDEVLAAYSDDSIRAVPVTWETPDPDVLTQGGEVGVRGTVDGMDLTANLTINVSTQKNYAVNPGFETGDFTAWTVEGDADAADISKEASNVYKGTYALHYWKGRPFAFTLSQTVTDLPDGTYSLSAWMHGGGGETSLQLSTSDCGGDPLSAEIVNTGWLEWQTPTIPTIEVSGGTCTFSLYVESSGGSWAFFDDVSLLKLDD